MNDRILQIIPADGWVAVFVYLYEEKGLATPTFEVQEKPLTCWALVERNPWWTCSGSKESPCRSQHRAPTEHGPDHTQEAVREHRVDAAYERDVQAMLWSGEGWTETLAEAKTIANGECVGLFKGSQRPAWFHDAVEVAKEELLKKAKGVSPA